MNDIIKLIKSIIIEMDMEAYIVGGYIRDKLMNPKNSASDLDIAFQGDF
ncbi:tRNA nucleotidyltransferase/poly(A) polymerase [Clostridium acetobutylicum]|nr:hypothetical protein [Clostridium acetobutylicum]NOV89098.1 tRNA nucleotidyltransferase/poly(A) polymerase [Clostridium acetobutylicum]